MVPATVTVSVIEGASALIHHVLQLDNPLIHTRERAISAMIHASIGNPYRTITQLGTTDHSGFPCSVAAEQTSPIPTGHVRKTNV